MMLYFFFRQLNSTCTASAVTPLMTAVSAKQHQCAVELLQLGAKLDIQDVHGDTVYHKAVTADPEIIPVSPRLYIHQCAV